MASISVSIFAWLCTVWMLENISYNYYLPHLFKFVPCYQYLTHKYPHGPGTLLSLVIVLFMKNTLQYLCFRSNLSLQFRSQRLNLDRTLHETKMHIHHAVLLLYVTHRLAYMVSSLYSGGPSITNLLFPTEI
jgi:hypothetical protein